MNNILGKRIALLREEKGLNQIELAKLLSISNTTLSQYEAGNRTPSNEILSQIADFFEVSTDYLLGRTNIRNNNKNKDDIFEQLGTIINRDAKPLTKKDKERLLKIIKSAWPVEDED